MKRKSVLLIIVSIVAFLLLLSIVMPFLFIGKPTNLCTIANQDANDHKVMIEIFDSDNTSIFKEIYMMEPGTRISQPKPEWLILKLSIPSGNSEECIIKATLDDNITETHRTDLQLWNTFTIKLYSEYRESPLSIGEVCV